MNLVNYRIGSSTTEQTSINASIDVNTIVSHLANNKDYLKTKKNNSSSKYESDFLNKLIISNKLIFSINKHEEIYCNFIKNNIEQLYNYLLFRYKFRISGEQKILFDAPLYLLIEPVSTCNLRCPFCFQTDKSFTKKPYMGVMKMDLFKRIADEADDIGVGAITLASRGEPTLSKNYTDMIEYISTKKNIYEIKTNTNATFLTEKICHSLLKNNVNQIVISADHYIKKDYERLRLGANFEKIVANVDMLFNIRKEFYPDSITEIRVSGVDNEKNLDLKKFEDFWLKRSDHVSSTYPLERWETYSNKIHPKINDPCYNLWDRMYVWFDGKVNPCDADYKSYLTYGDVTKNSIKEIWNGEQINQTRYLHQNKQRKCINPCNRCGVTFE